MGGNVKYVLRKGVKYCCDYWAYSCAIVLCLLIFCFNFASFFAPWYEDHYDGNFRYLELTPSLNKIDFNILEYLFYLQVKDFGDLGIITCDYSDSTCSDKNWELAVYYLPGLHHWDLTQYASTYHSIFSFGVISILIAFLLIPFLAVLLIFAKKFNRKVTLALWIVTLVISFILFAFLFIYWALIFDHPHMVQDALDISSSWCDQYNDDDAGPACAWIGSQSVGSKYIKNLPYLNVTGNDMTEHYGPSIGWFLATASVAMSIYIILIVIGWRPSFEES